MSIDYLSSTPVANIAQGRVEGLVADGALAFKGIPYARARRFMPPELHEGWSGIRAAQDFGASAPQTNASPPPGLPYVILAQIPRQQGASPLPPPPPESEDCQYLNIWTSALRDHGKRPVMVWLHGGFFYGGSGSTVDGSALAARGDVVVVSLNHRLNVFGFCDLREFGSEFAHSGNAGMLDIIAALRWIRENIEEFGGDPDRILVFGTSGGGMKTAFLMASPAAQGLFHRAAAQSGPGLRFMEPDRAREATALLFGALDLREGDVGALLDIPTERLLAGYHAVAAQLKPTRFIDLPCFAPVLDPELLPRHPFSPDAAPSTRAMPMILGWNAQEMSFFMGNDPEGFALDEDGFDARLEALFDAKADRIASLYRSEFPDAAPSARWIQAHTDYSVMLPVLAQADRRVEAASAPTFVYRLDFSSPALGGKLGALHTLEGNLLFNQPERDRALLGGGAGPVELARRMSSAWVEFAASGNPNGTQGALPDWPQFDLGRSPVMLFDTDCRIASNPGATFRQALAETLGA